LQDLPNVNPGQEEEEEEDDEARGLSEHQTVVVPGKVKASIRGTI
jgi:hypothetical protein